jgi:hypothetical protein
LLFLSLWLAAAASTAEELVHGLGAFPRRAELVPGLVRHLKTYVQKVELVPQPASVRTE